MLGRDALHGLGHATSRSAAATASRRSSRRRASCSRSASSARGYRYVWLDVGWWHGDAQRRRADHASARTQWPHGLAWLTRTLHAAGFLVGLYTDAGAERLRRRRPGQLRPLPAGRQHVRRVGLRRGQGRLLRRRRIAPQPRERLRAVPRGDPRQREPPPDAAVDLRLPAARTVRRRSPDRWTNRRSPPTRFGPSVGNSWRTDTDVGLPGNVSFADVLRNIDADAAAPQAAGPGHWNDPDYLGPGPGDVRRPVPLAVQHVGDARRAADDQRQPHARSAPRASRAVAEHRSDRDRPGSGGRPGHARFPPPATARCGSSRSATARAPSRC